MPGKGKKLHAAGAEKVKGHLAMLLFATLISGSFSLGHIVAPHIDPVALTTARFLLACTVMATLGLCLRKRIPIVTKSPWRFLILGGLMAFYFVMMFYALQIASPVSTGAVFTLIPLMSALFGWFLLGQRTGLTVFISLVVGALGAIWVIFRGDFRAILQLEIGRGEFIFFFGCAAHGFYTPLVRRLNRGEPIFDFALTTVLASAVCMVLWGASSVLNTDWMAIPTIVWITIAYLAIFTTAATFFLVQFASMRLPASKVMSYGYLIPGIIVYYEWVLGHGFVNASSLMGVLVIAGALIILAISPDN